MADLFASMYRLVGSKAVLSLAAKHETPKNPLQLKVLADLHWQKGEWELAIAPAQQVLLTCPDNFHALAILATSYRFLEKAELAYPYAKRLLAAKPPNWTLIKLIFAIVGLLKLSIVLAPDKYRTALRQCDVQAQADRRSLEWATEIVARCEDRNGSVAV